MYTCFSLHTGSNVYTVPLFSIIIKNRFLENRLFSLALDHQEKNLVQYILIIDTVSTDLRYSSGHYLNITYTLDIHRI